MAGPSFAFGHLADAHVGAWPRDPEVRAALRSSVVRAIEVVSERNLDFLLISGDLFHTPVPDPAEVAPVAQALRRLISEGRRVYAIYGSHDYVAHRTSWLDVLAEAGVFVRAAPDAVRAEGERWTLPFVLDEPTGARIAGISGRAHGLDRSYFRSVDSERFRAEPGFKIFQFHAAVAEYLPAHLRDHVEGISRDDLPGGCDYYAGGHIHYTYVGEGPAGGLLVNPGAVFGTSVTDLAHAVAGRTHQGLAVVTVRDGAPTVEHVDTAPRARIEIVDIDVSGRSPEAARATVAASVAGRSHEGALLFPRIHGVLEDGGAASLGLAESAAGAETIGASAVHWDLHDLTSPVETSAERSESDVERAVLETLTRSDGLPESFRGEAGFGRLGELLQVLATPIAEGEARQDYEIARTTSALPLLGLGPKSAPNPER